MPKDDSSKSPVTALEAGRWLRNPATGEVAHVLSVDDEGRRIEVDLWLQPGAAVARPSDGSLEVPAGTVHDWWNAGDGVAHVRWK